MADDTKTVEQLRQAVIERLCDCDPTTKFNHDTAQCMAEGVRRLDALIAAVRAEQAAPLPPRPNYGPETDTWEDRGYPGPPVCRCGHERDQHGSRTEQRDGQKAYVQPCEKCPCEVFVEKDGPLSLMIDSFHPMQRYGTVGTVNQAASETCIQTSDEPGYEAERRQQDTIEAAKQALIDETGAAAWERWLPKLDALIAAVRAEVRWFCPICGSKMTCSHPEKHG